MDIIYYGNIINGFNIINIINIINGFFSVLRVKNNTPQMTTIFLLTNTNTFFQILQFFSGHIYIYTISLLFNSCLTHCMCITWT